MSDLTNFNQTLMNVKTQKYLEQVLGEKKADFVTNITSLVANEKNLQECDPVTLMYAGIQATTLGLPLNKNLGFAYVIPYKNTRLQKTEAQFQVGYKGLIQLAIRSGQFNAMNVTEIREGEIKGYDLLTGEIVLESKPGRETLPIIGYASFFRLTNGFTKILYMTKEEMEQHGIRYSQTYGSKYDNIKSNSKWTTDFDAMAKKTVLKLLLSRYAPLSTEMQEGIKYDQAVIRDESRTPIYIDNNEVQDAKAIEMTGTANENMIVTDILKARTADDITAIKDSVGEEAMASERVAEALKAKEAEFEAVANKK